MPNFWQSKLLVGPWLTDALGLKATAGTPSLQLLIIPGNPGLSTFYKVFIQELHALFQGTADVWTVSNLGHDADNLSGGRVWCLDTQVQHKMQLIRDHVLAPGKPPAVLLAHSIGSYMTLQAIKRLEEEQAAAGHSPADTAQQIHRVMLLMPFLATDWSSSRQRLLHVAARFAHPLGSVAGTLQRLPTWLLDSLVRVAEPAAEPHTREGIKALLNTSGVRNNLHLAQHEFRDLDRPVDWDSIRRLGKRAVLVCAPDDIWYPMHHYFDTQAAVPGIEEYYSSELTHAFCCHTKQSQLVAQLVQLCVKKALHPDDLTAEDQQLEVSTAAADVSVLLGEQEVPLTKAAAAAAAAVTAPPAAAAAPAGSNQAGDDQTSSRDQEQQMRQHQVQQPAQTAA